MTDSTTRSLTALPVYNEAQHVTDVLDEVGRYCAEVLVVDDGSTDQTGTILAERPGLNVVTHATNRGYGAALQSAFQYAIDAGYDVLVTIDCDGQHEPQRISQFVKAAATADIVSGSRYLQSFTEDTVAPAERRWVNQCITAELNARLGLRLTDAFCGFKAYRVDALKQLRIQERRLCDAIAALGSGRCWSTTDHRTSRPTDLPRRRTILRRLAGRLPY